MTELQAFELLGRYIHADGQSSIKDGIPCSDAVAALSYLENYMNERRLNSPLVSAMQDDLERHNNQCKEMLVQLGDHNHGY